MTGRAVRSDEWETAVNVELSDSLTPRGIKQWWSARNLYLRGERPIDVLDRGEGKRVHEAAMAFSDGVYL